jgi:activator of HSP90 ATPase
MKNYSKYFKLAAAPDLVYQAFTNPFTLMLWSDQQAVASTTPGEEFSWFDGSIVGKNIRFETDKLVEQQWYFGEDETENPSIVTIKLHEDKTGTSVELRHTNIPDEAYDDIRIGWEEVVFACLKEYYSED